jgi:hypothetical protein
VPGLLNDVLARPWAIALLIGGAFLLPLLLADALRGAPAPRQIAGVTTAVVTEEDVDGPAAPGVRIPDLRPAPALPPMQTTPAGAP